MAQACQVIANHRDPATPVGIVRRAQRQGQQVELAYLATAAQAEVDMQTIVIVGNSQSRVYQGRMITPRGYINKYGDREESAAG